MFTFPMSQFGGGAPQVEFLGAFTNGAGTGLDVGPARSDRVVVVAAQRELDAASAFATPTINGSAATILVQPAISDPMVMAYAFVPTGTTANLACTNGTRMFGWVTHLFVNIVAISRDVWRKKSNLLRLKRHFHLRCRIMQR